MGKLERGIDVAVVRSQITPTTQPPTRRELAEAAERIKCHAMGNLKNPLAGTSTIIASGKAKTKHASKRMELRPRQLR
eukprot:scaffold33483_cov40-Prasinocladus_malaysianus.AAC.2